MAKKFVKVLEWASSKEDAWEKSKKHVRDMNRASPLAKKRFSIGPDYVSGKWAVVLWEK